MKEMKYWLYLIAKLIAARQSVWHCKQLGALLPAAGAGPLALLWAAATVVPARHAVHVSDTGDLADWRWLCSP